MPTEAPDFYKVIASYGHEITKKIGLYVWQPEENEWSCDDLCTIEQVAEKKQIIIEELNSYQEWELMEDAIL